MLTRFAWTALAVASASCGSTRIALGDIVEDLAAQDVVYFGEEHDNDVGHFQHLALLRMLHAERGDVVLSMEMFDREVQVVVDRYLGGEIDEETFLAESKPWGNYASHYRPMVEYAKEHGLPVIAANASRASLQAAFSDDDDPPDPAHVARSTSAPRDEYWDLFVEAMAEHVGADEGLLARIYAKQCLRDDTMAESIVAALDAHPGALVVHVCGKFHAELGLGTAARVAERRPGVRFRVLTMEAAPSVERGGLGDYTLIVPEAHPEPDDGESEDDGS